MNGMIDDSEPSPSRYMLHVLSSSSTAQSTDDAPGPAAVRDGRCQVASPSQRSLVLLLREFFGFQMNVKKPDSI